jgi:hypothetical protein
MRIGLKHFLIVGVGFGFLLAWALTLVINTALGALLHAVLGAPPTHFYLGSALLSLVAFTLVAACEIAGNRVFRSRFASAGLASVSLWVSTLLFATLVIAYVLPELKQVMDTFAANTRYFYRHGDELLLALSLPVARALVLPTIHFTVARITFKGQRGA